MPFLSLFVDEQDAEILLRWLSEEKDIAFIVPTGPKQWKAVSCVSELKDGNYSLWHVPSGPLPLLGTDNPSEIIANPWSGWTELVTGREPSKPYFGPGHPAEIRLSLFTRHQPYSQQERNELTVLNGSLLGDKDLLMCSDFQWISNRYQVASQQTHQWWRRLKRWVARKAFRLRPYSTASDHFERWSFWAFPSAYWKLKNGMEYYARGWDLKELHEAEGKAD
jgi:hypothetical protein